VRYEPYFKLHCIIFIMFYSTASLSEGPSPPGYHVRGAVIGARIKGAQCELRVYFHLEILEAVLCLLTTDSKLYITITINISVITSYILPFSFP